MITCQRASLLLEQELHEPLSWWQQFQLRLHLAGCEACRHFRRQAFNIRRIVRQLAREPEEKLTLQARQRIGERLSQADLP